jgi:PTS system galactitol-specific IIA component
VLDRELSYPTGLQARVTGVAVPHTDTTHVLLPAVAVATLKQPIIFNGMGAPDTKIDVYIVIMLAVHDPKEVITVLRKIIGIVQNDDAINKMLAAKKTFEIKEILLEQVGMQ